MNRKNKNDKKVKKDVSLKYKKNIKPSAQISCIPSQTSSNTNYCYKPVNSSGLISFSEPKASKIVVPFSF